MDCSMPGFPVYHQLLELAQTIVRQVSDAIQPSHPLLSSSPPAFNLAQHQGLFKWVSSSHQMAKVLELQLQSSQWIFRIDFLQDWLVWSPFCSRNSQESSLAPQFESISSSALSLLYDSTLTSINDSWKSHSFEYISLLFKALSRFPIAFLPKSKHLHFMATVTIHSDFGAQENKISPFPLFPHLFAMKWWDQMPWS